MADDTRRLSERDLPFQKVRSKQQAPKCECDSLAKRTVKTLAGVALTGDASGAVVGIVTDTMVNKLWPKKR